jgi:hypothetical protein
MTTDTDVRQPVRPRRGRGGSRAVALELEEAEEEDEAQLGTARLAEETEEQEEAEAALDELLRRQLTGTAPEEAVLFEDEEVGARARPADDGVQPRAVDEFVCHGCFLVKSRTQLAEPERSLCRDCADDARVR